MRKKIGIITGSGPEAGIDLWQKILHENKALLKENFHGDLDAPNVTILSVPELGHSMELEKNYEKVWKTLKEAVEQICQNVDFFVIACNTLNVYENKIEQIGFKHKFLSTLDVVKDYINENNLSKACIIGALPVLEMKEFSVFKSLYETFDIEVPQNFEMVHQLIYDVKKYGGESKKVINNFDYILNQIESNNIFLACTELPLIKTQYNQKKLIDVTSLLAKKLVVNSFHS
ncbi:aspartate/glutamate racemase family protein [Malaciobacter sp. WC5094]